MSEPDERLTMYHCPGCEMNSFAGDVEKFGHSTEEWGSQLACDRCGTRLTANDFYDYINTDVASHD